MGVVSAVPERVGGRYEVERVLGRGGMADVYAARDTVLDRPVAVKVLRDATNRDRFESEAQTLARLSHPGLVRVLDAGITHDQPWLVMDLVDGVTLADVCSGTPLGPPRAAEVGAQLAEALAYVHGNGVVHRDVKPGNVLLTRDDRVLLADFGIARLVEGAPAVTEAGFTIGTAAYLAPEQVRGQPVTPSADVYSLGLVLLEALTGEPAYRGSPAEAAVARLTRPPAVPEDLPRGWSELLTAMTAEDPAARPSAAQVAGDLRGLAEGTTTTALGTPSPPTRLLTVPLALRAESPRRTHRLPDQAARALAAVTRLRRRWVVAAALAVLLVLVLALSAGHGSQAPGTPRQGDKVTSDLQRLHDAVDGR